MHVKILKDGVAVKEIDINKNQLYELINDTDYDKRALELQIESPGLRAYTLTSG